MNFQELFINSLWLLGVIVVWGVMTIIVKSVIDNFKNKK